MKSPTISLELRNRILFLLGAIIVYRIGSHIPVPGIDVELLKEAFKSQKSGLLGMLDVFSGGALSRVSLFALGIMPYITASIIIQMLSHSLPSMQALRKEGSAGHRKITQWTRYLTVVLTLFQAYGVAVALEGQSFVMQPGISFRVMMMVSFTTGTMFLLWLGEQITERGVGNGISIIIFTGIASGMPTGLVSFLELVRNGTISALPALLIMVIIAIAIVVVVFFERAQRRIPVNYPRMQMGQMGKKASHMPMKLNISGVIPPIFASSLLLFPTTMLSWVNTSASQEGFISLVRNFAASISPGSLTYVVIYGALVVFFAFFYTGIVFNAREQSDNLKKSGALIPGMRPGEQTSKYLDNMTLKLTIIGATYLTVICILPELLRMGIPAIPFYIGGTTLLILVVVALDFQEQISAHLMSQQYESLLKKARFKKQLDHK